VNNFEYTSPTDAAQVSHLLGTNWQDGAILAGGTDLLALMKDGIVQPKRLVNVKQLRGLANVQYDAHQGLTIGALARMQDVADNTNVRKVFPALAEACDDAASPQIRNMATMGGNLLQRPRCWYFRNGFGLLAMRDGKSLVTQGDNRYHAILGNEGPAYFVSPSTVAPILIAYGAKVVIADPNGKNRLLALENLYRIPKTEDEREHAIAPNELLTNIVVQPAPQARSANYEVRQKHSFDWPLATASVVLTMAGANVKSARIVMGHVAPVPWVSKEAEEALAGKPVSAETAQAAADAAVRNAKGLGNNNYKIQYARVAVKRALLKAAGITA
jgi:xanthine dehydrogenase YagS FAD-binding subunit